jgi:AraC family transcriptional regulator
MIPRIEYLTEKKLIGKRLTMSLVKNKTGELWQSFMPKRKEVLNTATNDLISMQVYKPSHFIAFNPSNEFEKWATVEVTNFESVPTDMETYILVGGLYAIFDYKDFNTFSGLGYRVQNTY